MKSDIFDKLSNLNTIDILYDIIKLAENNNCEDLDKKVYNLLAEKELV